MALVSQELMEKANKAQSVEELMALAKEAGIELTQEDATVFIADKKIAENGEIPDEELNNVAGGSKCRGGKFYSSDPPYYLITTALNSCSLFEEKSGQELGRHCTNCKYYEPEGLVRYCTRRKYDNDPLNK